MVNYKCPIAMYQQRKFRYQLPLRHTATEVRDRSEMTRRKVVNRQKKLSIRINKHESYTTGTYTRCYILNRKTTETDKRNRSFRYTFVWVIIFWHLRFIL